jgi:hypothetical protein
MYETIESAFTRALARHDLDCELRDSALASATPTAAPTRPVKEDRFREETIHSSRLG